MKQYTLFFGDMGRAYRGQVWKGKQQPNIPIIRGLESLGPGATFEDGKRALVGVG
jgi:hypothetical protein